MNGVTENYNYDDGDKLLSAGSKTYTYDLAGRTKTVFSFTGGVTTLNYDDESRLTSVGGAMGTHSYSYNGMDTRTSKVANGVTTNYHRDGAYVTDPVIWDTGATYTPGISERRNSATTFLHGGLKDQSAQSNTSQTITATRVYDAYGMVTNSTGAWKGPFGYSGSAGYQEDETGLQLLGHRYYDPSTGRFLTRDPIQDGRNWYSYCDNNPVNCVDANGLEKVIIVVGPTKGSQEAAAQEYIVGVIIEKLLSLGYTRNDILILTSPGKKALVAAAADAETLVFVGHGSYEGEFNYTGDAYFEGSDRDSLRRARSKNGVQKRFKRVWLYHCFSGRSLASWSDLAEEIVYFERFHSFTDLLYPKISGGSKMWKSPLLKDPRTKTGHDPRTPTRGKGG